MTTWKSQKTIAQKIAEVMAKDYSTSTNPQNFALCKAGQLWIKEINTANSVHAKAAAGFLNACDAGIRTWWGLTTPTQADTDLAMKFISAFECLTDEQKANLEVAFAYIKNNFAREWC